MKAIHLLPLAAALGTLSAHRAPGQSRFATLYEIGGENPLGLAAANGSLYGTTSAVGQVGGNCGTVFELRPPATQGGAWTETTLHAFTGLDGDGCVPVGPPGVGGGAVYGVTNVGGAFDCGAVYELQPPATLGGAWTESVLYSFPTVAAFPFGVIIGQDGRIYVGTSGGGDGWGSLLQLNPPAAPGGTWTALELYSFPPSLSTGGPSSLTMGPDGIFYGTIGFGGTAPTYAGAVFELKPPATAGGDWIENILYDFQGVRDGSTPNSLTVAADGTLYGTTFGTAVIDDRHGPYGVGTVFRLTPPPSPGVSWTKTTLAQLSVGDERGPDSPLILRKGDLYGTSSSSGSIPGGLVFEIQPPATPGGDWTTTYLHKFDGETPGGALVMDHDGTIYGATVAPQAERPSGTVYSMAPK